jgi:8-oxo-dGTP pyrophosphatase MutT (NUDIX family)
VEKDRLKVRLAVFLILHNSLGIVLMRRLNTGHRDGEWGLPSGHVESGESPEEAVIREAWEEARVVIQADSLKLAHTQFNAESGLDRLYINLYFFAARFSGEPQIGEPGQCSEMTCVAPSGLPKDTIPYVRTAIEAYYNIPPRWDLSARIYSEVGF